MAFEAELRNVNTGKIVKVDPVQARLSRMRRRIHAWSEVVKEVEIDRGLQRKVMIGLTYAPDQEWKANHIRDYIKAMKQKLGDGLLALAWAAEMQKRGAVHYHIYLIVIKGTRIPKPDKSGMWKFGASNIQTGKSAFYLVAYLKSKDGEKAYQKKGFPKGCRIFSVWVKKKVLRTWTWTKFRWSALPAWLREELDAFGFDLIGLFPKRKEGGGWVLELPIDRREFFGWKWPVIEFQSPWVMV